MCIHTRIFIIRTRCNCQNRFGFPPLSQKLDSRQKITDHIIVKRLNCHNKSSLLKAIQNRFGFFKIKNENSVKKPSCQNKSSSVNAIQINFLKARLQITQIKVEVSLSKQTVKINTSKKVELTVTIKARLWKRTRTAFLTTLKKLGCQNNRVETVKTKVGLSYSNQKPHLLEYLKSFLLYIAGQNTASTSLPIKAIQNNT